MRNNLIIRTFRIRIANCLLPLDMSPVYLHLLNPPFHQSCLLRYARVAYRGLAKNFHRFNVLFASANMIMCARAGRLREFCGA